MQVIPLKKEYLCTKEKVMKKLLGLVVFICMFSMDMLAQCPMCKASVESSRATAGAKSVGMGLNGGILMLLASVYVIIFSVGIIWYRNYRKNQIINNA
jgi:hypothetical protein